VAVPDLQPCLTGGQPGSARPETLRTGARARSAGLDPLRAGVYVGDAAPETLCTGARAPVHRVSGAAGRGSRVVRKSLYPAWRRRGATRDPQGVAGRQLLA